MPYLHSKAHRIFDLSGEGGLPTAFLLELVVRGEEMLELDPSPDDPLRDLWAFVGMDVSKLGTS